ncbi:FAD/NAD(P)-binding domain-containing protein [Aspergillus pseudoustus]|uniref:FAD/NAD(P)-binding domain-containing protein n=1 Tax=Aspergillus pseudoustus TaxID=1810923 RepID=A0ABR4J8R4_9EURO
MEKSLKLIVVGGGPVGLTAAHALHHASIEFVVLERRDAVIIDEGASLVLGPQSLRIMHQFGLLDRLLEIGGEVRRNKAITHDGKVFRDTFSPQGIRKNHGTAPVTFHRAELIQVLYDGLPPAAKERYFTGKDVVNITSNDDGVEVACADGSVYSGAAVLGVDGVHSRTRRLMRKDALGANLKSGWDPERPFTATYKCLWCSFARPSDTGESYETQSKDQSVMYLTGRERAWIFLYEKLPQPTSERTSYTKDDVDAFAAKFAEFPVTEDLKVKDVYAKRTSVGMANLEEGIAGHWSCGRIVLAGDACHKFTPNAGLGLNAGIQDVVVLCNLLHKAMKTSPAMDTAAFGQLFKEYRKLRVKDLKAQLRQSAYMTRMQAWANGAYFVLARYVTNPAVVQQVFIRTLVANAIKQGLVLEYVPASEPFQGKVKWVHPLKS